MKAIILTYDKNRALTEHVLLRYQTLWPDHPFSFRIPYQKLCTIKSPEIEYIKSPVSIKATVLRLLEDLEDEQWIYWCIDDKYPISLNIPRIRAITEWLPTIKDKEISGILFCNCKKRITERKLTGEKIKDYAGNLYFERKGYQQIWIHQFLRVKVLRHFFLSMPDYIPFASHMEKIRKRLDKPLSHRMFVTKENFAAFGESMTKGVLTKNCYKSMLKVGIKLPDGITELCAEKKFGSTIPSFLQLFQNALR